MAEKEVIEFVGGPLDGLRVMFKEIASRCAWLILGKREVYDGKYHYEKEQT